MCLDPKIFSLTTPRHLCPERHQDPARRAMATLLGADLVVDPTEPGYKETVQDFCGDTASEKRKEGCVIAKQQIEKTTFYSTAVGQEFKTMAHQRHGNVAQACPGCHATNNFHDKCVQACPGCHATNHFHDKCVRVVAACSDKQGGQPSWVRKTASFFEFSLCLSRACLGKMFVFIYKWLKNAVFRRPDVVLEGASTWAAIQTSMDLCANNGAVVVVARHYDAPEFNPVGQGYFGKRLQLLTVYGHPTPGSRWDMRTSYAHTLDLLSRGA